MLLTNDFISKVITINVVYKRYYILVNGTNRKEENYSTYNSMKHKQ